MPRNLSLALAVLFLLLTSHCAPAAQSDPLVALTPYITLTASATATLLPLGDGEGAQTALPTSTPFTYIIQAGDTMGALAQKFGVSLDALIAANPSISPNVMPVGAILLIPSDQNNPTGEATPTPVPFVISQIDCHPTLDNGMWCFALARNDSDSALENLSARISLLSADGGVVAAQDALPPLNVIPPHASLPLTAFFPPPAPLGARPRAQILSATSLAPDDTRYLPAALGTPLIEIAADGRTARVRGEVALPANAAAAQTVWVAAVAYDEMGRVVGFRRWEGSGLQPGASLPFQLTVASLGSRVTRVEVFVEVRP
ncbi:MAG: LysM peptidoglycan-binding domain-containing protein [Anaerolineaceae bacterium]|nr:MAG: LysM peptidoglycan-binding domain-containing protein [Anaerolineaceae bacterium]